MLSLAVKKVKNKAHKLMCMQQKGKWTVEGNRLILFGEAGIIYSLLNMHFTACWPVATSQRHCFRDDCHSN